MTDIKEPHLDPAVRHDLVLLFDVRDGNPNGDPDGGNQPRTDPETGHGLVTDVALKRKIRDTVPLVRPDDPRYGIFVEAGYALNPRIAEGFTSSGGTVDTKRSQSSEAVAAAQSWLCDRYFDIRMFGAVLSTGNASAGQIRGPLQFGFARSVSAVVPADHTITRVTQTRQEDIDKGERTELGGKWTVPYGLYRAHAYYSAGRALKTGVTSEDLTVLYTAIQMMFDHDRSATRGELSLRGLWAFSHSSAFGNAPAAALTDQIRLTRVTASSPPRSHLDYHLTVPNGALPDGVTVSQLVNHWA